MALTLTRIHMEALYRGPCIEGGGLERGLSPCPYSFGEAQRVQIPKELLRTEAPNAIVDMVFKP